MNKQTIQKLLLEQERTLRAVQDSITYTNERLIYLQERKRTILEFITLLRQGLPHESLPDD